MSQKDIYLSGKEVKFDIEELFYSVTDKRSIILDFNSVFRIRSGYSNEELLNSPHRLIRHPHMPRSVFYLLWESLLSGKEFCGYVNNRAKNGDNYWVFAWAAPLKDYLISIRQRPTNMEVFNLIKTLYAEMHESERKYENIKDQIQAGLDTLYKALQSVGFSNYEEFFRQAALSEFLQRSRLYDFDSSYLKGIDQQVEQRLRDVGNNRKDLLPALEKILNFSLNKFDINKASEVLKQVSLNLAIRAKKMGDQASTLDCISVELRRFSDYFQTSVEEISHLINNLIINFKNFIWVECFKILLEEVKVWQTVEMATPEMLEVRSQSFYQLWEAQKNMIQDLLSKGLTSKVDSLSFVADRFLRFEKNLNFTTVCGRSESSRLPDTESFWALLDQVTKIAQNLNKVSFSISELQIALNNAQFRFLSEAFKEVQHLDSYSLAKN